MDESTHQTWPLSRILTFVGGGIVGLGLLIWFVMLSSGAGGDVKKGDNSLFELAKWPLLVCTVGSVCFSIGLWIGFRSTFAKSNRKDSPVSTLVSTVVTKYIKNKRGENVESPNPDYPDQYFYYVLLRSKEGDEHELRTIYEVYGEISEGMQGTATIDGRWLGKFIANRPSSTS